VIYLAVAAAARAQDPEGESPESLIGRFLAGDDGTTARIRSLGPGTLPAPSGRSPLRRSWRWSRSAAGWTTRWRTAIW
jgi:hypothetical protein